MSENRDPTKQPQDMQGDIQRLVEATTNLAEAAVQPMVRTLTVLGDSIGSEPPRVRLAALDNAGTSLLSSSIRLAEKLTTLALDIVAPRRGDAEGGVGATPTGRAGESLRIPMAVENPGPEAMQDLNFQVVALTGPEGTKLSGASLSVAPQHLSVAPGDFEKLILTVDVPPGTLPGVYEGRLGLEGRANFQVPFRFKIV